MCGIVGVVGVVGVKGAFDRALLERMNDVITHRGPDDEGTWMPRAGGVGLGNRRLAILDLSPAGHMPMHSADGSLTITYNGELYNYPDLRREIEAHGDRYVSNGDTEALLHLYRRYGPAFVSRLNGMFAFALWDEPRGQLMLARDRAGIKPLYYTLLPDGIAFGSEIKSLLLLPSVRAEPDLEAVRCAVSFGWVPAPLTGFRGIYKLEPGHYLLWKDGVLSRHPFSTVHDLPEASTSRRSIQDWAQDFRETFYDAVARQCQSDVPVGVLLSGGLDSSAIVAATAAHGLRLRSYTIAYRGQDQRLEQVPDESAYARAVATRFDTIHTEIVAEPTMTDLLPDMVWHMDEPLSDQAAISTYVICKTAREHVTVLLSGQGGDEVLAGYRTYTSHKLAGYYRRLPVGARRLSRSAVARIPGLSGHVPGVPPGLMLAAHRYLSHLTRYGAYAPADRHAAYHTFFSPEERASLFTPAFTAALAGTSLFDYHRRYYGDAESAGLGSLQGQLYVDQKTFLVERNLLYADKIGMAASTELRVPFLDNAVLDCAARLPANVKLHNLTGKYVLRTAMRGVLPDSVIDRRKAGFGLPIRSWLMHDLRPLVDDLLSDESVRRRGYFQPEMIARVRAQADQGIGHSAQQVWNLLTLELWHRVFFDQGGRLQAERRLCQSTVPGMAR